MVTKRFKDQILYQILEACNKESMSKTKIVYSCNLNFKTILPYISILVGNNLIEVVSGSPMKYKTTERGIKVLEHLRAIEILVPSINTTNSRNESQLNSKLRNEPTLI
jgi:predicted transcriptional regulator